MATYAILLSNSSANIFKIQLWNYKLCRRESQCFFFGPFDINNEPFIRVAVGDYYDLLNKSDKDDALAVILVSITHELTHYFQWIKHHDEWCYADDILNNYYERQALYYANVIVYSDYANIVDHP